MEKGTGIILLYKGNESKQNNEGFSLVELIVVMAMMFILVGGMSISASLVFSRDAAQCASKLNDAIYTARMDSMSKPGAYFMQIKKVAGEFEVVLNDGTSDVYSEKISENGKIKAISFDLNGENGQITDSNTVKIVFDKSKGYVKTFNDKEITTDGANGTYKDGLIVFTVSQKTGTKTEDVTLVTSTGKHKVGK